LINIKLCLSSQINPHDHIQELNRVIDQHYIIIIDIIIIIIIPS
jgi:hypothetical protein